MNNLEPIKTPKKPVGNPLWVKGYNPKAHILSVAEPNVRLKELVRDHGIATILKAMNEPEFLAETFSTYDGMHIISLAKALKGDHQAYEHALNRMFGKVPDKQINLNLNIEADPDKLSERANGMLSSLAGLDDDNSDLIED